MPAFEDLFPRPDDESEDFEYLPEPRIKDMEEPVCILHSSGVFEYLGSTISIHYIVILRLGRIPKASHLNEPQLDQFLPLAMARRP